MNTNQFLMYSFLVCMFGLFPLSAVLLFSQYKQYFRGFRLLIAIFLYSFLSWGTVNGFILLRYLLDPMNFRGPEGAFALFFGWLYLWITSLPVFLVFPAVRTIYDTVRKEK